MKVKHDPVADHLRNAYPYKLDLENCEKEPLHHIQNIQPQSCVIASEPDADLTVRFVSENSLDVLGVEWRTVMDRPLADLLPPEVIEQIEMGRHDSNAYEALNPIQFAIQLEGERILKNAICHHNGKYVVVEVEPVEEIYQTSAFQALLGRALLRIQDLSDSRQLYDRTARIVREVTGYDRIMIYRFDPQYNGEVVAEAVIDGLPRYHGLHYPHTDIPKQARDLYLKNRIRIVNGVRQVPVRLQRSTSVEWEYLDLSLTHARGVSPIHIEYLNNMGVNTTMSVAIVVDNKLWGLIAMHHHEPRFLDYQVRRFLLFIGQVFGGHLTIHAANERQRYSVDQNIVQATVGEQITAARDLFKGLTQGRYNLLDLFRGTEGAAISYEDRYECFGQCPPEEVVRELALWAAAQPGSKLVYHSNSIGREYAAMDEYREVASGVLIIYLGAERKEFICWFRPEVSRTIAWGGHQHKELLESEDGTRRLSPRKSFERFVESVSGYSRPWDAKTTESALDLRVILQNSMLRRYVEVKQHNQDLRQAYSDLETFSYTVSHDLRAPLRAIDGFAEILAEDFAHMLNEEGREVITRIQNSAEQMNVLISDILELSRVGRVRVDPVTIDMYELATKTVDTLRVGYLKDRDTDIRIATDLPPLRGDKRMIDQLMVNLVSNAMKYILPDADGNSWIEIGHEHGNKEDDRTVYYVANSGPTIPMEYHSSIFETFSRLSNTSHIEGSGVGLAIVRRIVERHAGTISVDPDFEGVKFMFSVSPTDPS